MKPALLRRDAAQLISGFLVSNICCQSKTKHLRRGH
jgi:hypothetical protein